MASTVTLPLAPLGMGPETGNAVVIHAAISPPRSLILYRAGQAYSAYHRRRQNNSTEADDYEQHILPQDLARTKVESEVVIPEALVLDEVTKDLLDLDPAEWKKQDHYLVLGLSSLRYKATQAQIKKAHQMRALQFHPDKSASTGNSHNETFFKCVQRAYELLTDPVRRPQFDSVDPTISDDIPKARLGSSGQDFFSTYGPVFEREGRFSKKQPVPMLGDMDAPREEMEAFYRFWTQFDSWRSYEYLDKENDQLENREEKRWHEKKNKTERTRLKKEDTKRVSTLVQQAMSADPRIGKYKAMERLEKDKKRLAREAAVKKAESERLCAEEEKRKQALQRAEQEAQVAAEERLRREKIKKEYRLIKRSVREAAKQYNYLLDANSSAPAALARRSAELDLLLENISQDEALELQSVFTSGACDQVQILAAMVEAISGVIAKTPAVASSFTSFTRGADIAARVKQEKQKETDKAQLPAKTQREWTAKELELLIKATNKFPGGTIDRWETVSAWMAQHGGFTQRTEEELLQKTSDLRKGAKSGSGSMVRELQSKKLHNDDQNMKNEASVRYDGPSEAAMATATPTAVLPVSSQPAIKEPAKSKAVAKVERPWSSEEQTQLEKALREYPPSYKETDRWDKIADGVAGRTKKECKLRVKFLAEQVRSKKAGATAAN